MTRNRKVICTDKCKNLFQNDVMGCNLSKMLEYGFIDPVVIRNYSIVTAIFHKTVDRGYKYPDAVKEEAVKYGLTSHHIKRIYEANRKYIKYKAEVEYSS